MWHMTCDRWWTLCQYFRFLSLTVWELWSCEDLEEKDDFLYQSMTKVFVEQPCYTRSGKYSINQSVTLHVRRTPNDCRQEILGRLTWLRHSSRPPSFVSSVISIVFQCSRRPSIFRHCTVRKKRPLFFKLDCLPRRASKWKMHFLVMVLKFGH